ncbi:MAG: helix-turn-helix domain-containing protein, partial [Nanopusillaceae archaeon]
MVADKYQSSVTVSGGGATMELPENVALLPLREKEKYIVELRKQGKTYREIVKILKVSPSTVARV